MIIMLLVVWICATSHAATAKKIRQARAVSQPSTEAHQNHSKGSKPTSPVQSSAGEQAHNSSESMSSTTSNSTHIVHGDGEAGPQDPTAKSISVTTEPALSVEEDDRFALVQDDAVRATQGPIAFWLRYEATPKQLELFHQAEHVQHQIDDTSRELGEQKRNEQQSFKVQQEALLESRDGWLDSVPHYWSRRWTTMAPSFWQYPYWSTLAMQRAHVLAPSDEVLYVPVDDEVFLKHSLSHLRCRYHDAHISDSSSGSGDDGARHMHEDGERGGAHRSDHGALLTLEFSFTDAPDSVFPFTERNIRWTLPVAMAQRFGTIEHRFQPAGLMDAVVAKEDRYLGNGTRLRFRPEVVDAALRGFLHHEAAPSRPGVKGTSSSGGATASATHPKSVFPNPQSFFFLFGPQEQHETMSRDQWVRHQSRLGALVRDVCHITSRCCEDSDETPHEDTAKDHASSFEEWLAQVDQDAETLDRVAVPVDEL